MATRMKARVVPKTANYNINSALDQHGTIFTNEGATGPVTFTLPTPNAQHYGGSFRFVAVADQNIIVMPPVADTAIVLNDGAADSLALSTAGQRIGGALVATCLRTGGTVYQWHIQNDSVGHAATVAT